ncbi:MAG: carboxypeptidase regulatory-like domain-containing protein [Burkholderiales bacterium]
MCMHGRLSRTILIVGAAIQLGAPQALTSQTIRGKLLEQITDNPIANAAVSLIAVPDKTIAETTTNGSGDFTLKPPEPGTFRLRAVVKGYRIAVSPAIALKKGDDVSFTWRIMPDTIYLQPVVVTANNRRSTNRLGGFYDRMSRAIGGRFITRDDIEKRRPFRVTDLLATEPGLRLVPGRFGDDVVTTDGCRPDVYLDGVRFPLLGEKIDNIVNPQDIEGIEVYPHIAEVPAEFMRAGQNCGAIVIWTRIGG